MTSAAAAPGAIPANTPTISRWGLYLNWSTGVTRSSR